MQLFSPDVLSDIHGLSMGLSITAIVIGLLVWLTGWWGHRFWVVLVTTLLAGIFGLSSSPAHRIQPLVVGLLLAVAAGVLALALVAWWRSPRAASRPGSSSAPWPPRRGTIR